MNRIRGLFFTTVLAIVLLVGGLFAAGFFDESPFSREAIAVSLSRFPPNSVTHLEKDGVFVVRKADATVRVFSDIDPHRWHKTAWNQGERQFHSPEHGEIYTMDGQCIAGPCPRDLYRVQFEVVGETIRIYPHRFVGGGPPENLPKRK